MVSIDLQDALYGLFKEAIIGPLKFKMTRRSDILKIEMTSFFCQGWSELDEIWQMVQNDMPTAEIWSKSKPEVDFQYIHTYIHTNEKIKVTLSQYCCRGTVQNYC